MPDEISHQLDRSISVKGVGWYFTVFPHFNRKLCKQTVKNQIGRRVLRRPIGFYNVCICPTEMPILHLKLGERSGSMVNCLTRDRITAGSSIIGGTVLCP